jgi:hypothetical protein
VRKFGKEWGKKSFAFQLNGQKPNIYEEGVIKMPIQINGKTRSLIDILLTKIKT